MASTFDSKRIRAGKLGSSLLPELIEVAITSASKGNDQNEFYDEALKTIHAATSATSTQIVRGVKGQWRTIATCDEPIQPPSELLSDCLDNETSILQNSWAVAPLESPNVRGLLLVQKLSAKNDGLGEQEMDSLAAALALAVNVHRINVRQSRRASRLEAILNVTAHWNQSRETDELLVEIAEASTKLLNAERATIFLPAPRGKHLIGRPALGVEGGELKIPADAGVVGQVMKTGEPQRVDLDIAAEQAQIHRDVDEKLDFETRTLICVPLKNSKGKTVGAFELINKNEGNFNDADQADLLELATHASAAIETTQHVEQLVSTQKNMADEAAGQVQLIGECDEIQKLKSTIERVAGTDLAILITGENGTGKEVVAQMVHYLSDRRDQVLVAVNCAAITETLLESELFGHEKGAFTDAHQAREGKFELAIGGTLFLDEIGDMSLGGQAKLLRVLEEKIVVRVGGSTPIPTNARVIAATNQKLNELVSEKKFREDLFFRLNVLTIQLPPLRDRGDDVILLAEHFLKEFCVRARRQPLQLNASAKKRLTGHSWPGNVRELRNMMERLAYLFQGDKVGGEDLEFIISPRKSNDSLMDLDLPLADATKQFQVQFIQQHIDRSGGNMTDAANRMGLHRSNLYRKMRQLGMVAGDDEKD